MKSKLPQNKRIILSYGKKTEPVEGFDVIDIMSTPDWLNLIPSEGKVLVDKKAYIYVIKKLSPDRILDLDKAHLFNEKPIKEEEKNFPSAATIDNIIISNRYHRGVKDKDVWLSSYHVELLQNLLSELESSQIELLDEHNNIVKVIREEKDGDN